MNIHVFACMPFGVKEDIDFDRIYRELIVPAVESAGCEALRADYEREPGSIQADMFQELLLADLVIADLSIDNPNVWYELGVRHALRARGAILIQTYREKQPFDIYTDRKLRYHTKDGVPDPDYLEKDKMALAEMVKASLAAWHGKKISPVFYHLPYLKEPQWKELKIGEAQKFWELQKHWELRIEEARRKNRPGDIALLAAEAPVAALRFDAYMVAMKALKAQGKFTFALEQVEKALDIDPDDLNAAREKGLLLGKLKNRDGAKTWLSDLHTKHPEDPETCAYLGRLYKEDWVEVWNDPALSPEKRRMVAADENGLLREGINACRAGFQNDPCHFYSGINALTLMCLSDFVNGAEEYSSEIKNMAGALSWSVQCLLKKKPNEYWARATYGELAILTGTVKEVTRAYQDAAAVAEKNWFALDSSRQQVALLHALEFKPEHVAAALEVLEREISRLSLPAKVHNPARIFLFSGHMIDASGRDKPRFPPEKEKAAAEAIRTKLDELRAGEGDLALCGGACGGDLLFAEACLKRGLSLEIRIPFEEAFFLKESVDFAGDTWQSRYYKVIDNANTKRLIMPTELGPTPSRQNDYSRNNKWQLYCALSWGAEKMHLICLWDGKTGDGPGGTSHMIEEAKKRNARTHVIDMKLL
jgi:tetratricopeptide (TPR) repeat protein